MVQFCHGAPGTIPTYIAAIETFNFEDVEFYSETLFKAAECTWVNGLTKKGYGLCHGISGNGYCLLSMYRYTKDEMWLKRAL